jgi:hypothetical protein
VKGYTYKEGKTDSIKKKGIGDSNDKQRGVGIYSSFFKIGQVTHCILALIEYRIDLLLFLLRNRMGFLFLME